jgi:hypothetical protein
VTATEPYRPKHHTNPLPSVPSPTTASNCAILSARATRRTAVLIARLTVRFCNVRCRTRGCRRSAGRAQHYYTVFDPLAVIIAVKVCTKAELPRAPPPKIVGPFAVSRRRWLRADAQAVSVGEGCANAGKGKVARGCDAGLDLGTTVLRRDGKSGAGVTRRGRGKSSAGSELAVSVWWGRRLFREPKRHGSRVCQMLFLGAQAVFPLGCYWGNVFARLLIYFSFGCFEGE